MRTWVGSSSLIGETLDSKYKLIRLLGEGGMGSVYEAEHVRTLQRVALKVIHNKLLLRPGNDGVARFRREARAAGAINSEHIVHVLDSGTDEASGLLYLVMEYLRGEDLQHLIDRLGPLTPDTALRIAAQALIGLQKAHEAQIVHRDIKPANLFLAQREDGVITVKLLDFGIAKIKADPLSFPHTTGLTNTGGFLGSPLYMSPEQVRNSRDVDHRTDLWSLGCTLYCALVGHAPYGHVSSVGELVFAILRAAPPSVQEVAPWIPKAVAKVVQGALAIKPEERYPSAAAMFSALRPLITGYTALHEEMLAPVSAEQRAESAPTISSHPPPVARRVGMDLGKTGPLLGHEITQEANPTGLTRDESVASLEVSSSLDATTRVLRPAAASARPAPQVRARVAVGVVLVAGLGAAWVYTSRSQPLPVPSNATATPAPSSPQSAEPPVPSVSAASAPISSVPPKVEPPLLAPTEPSAIKPRAAGAKPTRLSPSSANAIAAPKAPPPNAGEDDIIRTHQ